MKIKNKGSGLENLVYEIYSDLGYQNLQKNVRITKKTDNTNISAEIDLTYELLMSKRYIECKYRRSSNVTLQEVAKFVAVLELFNIPTYAAEIITNTSFDKRAIEYAAQKSIVLLDGVKLAQLESQRKHGINAFLLGIRSYDIYKNKGIFGLIDYFYTRMLTVKKQIQKYMN